MRFVYPLSLSQACDYLLDGENSVPIAGGTDLSLLLEKQTIRPALFVDLTRLGLNYIRHEIDRIIIGAATPIAALLQSKVIQEKLPILYQAAGKLGSVQCRAIGTVGGNLCSAVPSADTATPLLALNAEVILASRDSIRKVPLTHFFISPRKTILARGELLVEIHINRVDLLEKGLFIKYGRRKAVTLSTVNVAAQRCASEGIGVKRVAIALGAVAPTPIRAVLAERFLEESGQLDENILNRVCEIAVSETRPISDQRASLGYRKEITMTLLNRVLHQLLDFYPVEVK